jgi:hypothetical protein
MMIKSFSRVAGTASSNYGESTHGTSLPPKTFGAAKSLEALRHLLATSLNALLLEIWSSFCARDIVDAERRASAVGCHTAAKQTQIPTAWGRGDKVELKVGIKPSKTCVV